MAAYADTKLANTMFAYAFARRFGHRGVRASSVDPGWVPTKMTGMSAPGDIRESDRLYVMLAEDSGEAEGTNACYWESGSVGPARSKEEAYDEEAQDALLEKLEEITGVAVPN
ncbi:hypothetical protein ONZ43_g7619 [Nemania bipapillata]|uniref:Uncharacterized protein n=1 Tax=Nemania bipapillata TaxID=110536 RepID=A0ACC2HPQ6_9PEZI|nr:hypothetical protein ONZ43_g7619 [Nemania bipapillata]